MKHLLFVLSLVPTLSFGQKDYCKNVTKDVKDIEGVVTYRSPLVGKNSILSISKTIEDTTASYSLYVGVLNEAGGNTKGITVRLEDGSVFKDIDQPIITTMVDANAYNISGSLPVEEMDIEAFGNSRIVSVSCGGLEHAVPQADALRLLGYVKCLMDR